MKKFQKIILITAFIVMAALFLYALSFSTGMAKGERVGSYFDEVQQFNHQIYTYSLYGLAFFGIFLALGSVSKTRFNVLNIITGLLAPAFMIATSLIALVELPNLKKGYQALIGSDALDITLMINLGKTPSTFIYDIGLVLHSLGLVFGLLSFGFIIYKIVERILYDHAYKKQVKLYESTR